MDAHSAMASVNTVLLLGVVAAEPRQRDDSCDLVIGVPEERAGRSWLERIALTVHGRLVPEAMELRPAQPIHAAGHLSRGPSGRVVVMVSHLFAIGEAPPAAPESRAPLGSHASPHPHERVGHPRRIHIGRPDERIIWVRPAHVGGQRSRTE